MKYTNNKLIDLLGAFIKHPLSSCQEVIDNTKMEDQLVQAFMEIKEILELQACKLSAGIGKEIKGEVLEIEQQPLDDLADEWRKK